MTVLIIVNDNNINNIIILIIINSAIFNIGLFTRTRYTSRRAGPIDRYALLSYSSHAYHRRYQGRAGRRTRDATGSGHIEHRDARRAITGVVANDYPRSPKDLALDDPIASLNCRTSRREHRVRTRVYATRLSAAGYYKIDCTW